MTNALLPTITLHGTHPNDLESGWTQVASKIDELRNAMRHLEFNGRDYQPGEFGDASKRMEDVERTLADFERDVLEVRIHIADTRGNR